MSSSSHQLEQPAPRSVRLALRLLAVPVVIDTVLSVRTKHPVLQPLLTMLVFGGLWYAIATRRNWGRFGFAGLFLVAVPFTIIRVPSYLRGDPFEVVVSLALTVLEAVGLSLLFLPGATAWYRRSRSAV